MASIGRRFRNMTPDGWQNLALAALFFVYIIQVALDLLWGHVFGNLVADFASFWTAGRIANEYGYEAVYDLGLVARLQGQLLPARAVGLAEVRPLPAAFLPVFILPFQLLAILPAHISALVWVALNVAGTALYLWRFTGRLTGRPLETRLLLLTMAAVPVFLNLFLGQVNLWLMICVGEFVLAQRSKASWQAGAWLAGLMLKPQVLLLIAPALLLQRWWKTVLGMLSAGLAIVMASWLLGGGAALSQLMRLWLGFAVGIAGNDPQIMMNWRMIGFHLQGVAGSAAAAAVVAVGMLVTAGAALAMWWQPFHEDQRRTAFAITGMMAGTALLAWHSHVHMAVILIPPMLVLLNDGGAMPARLYATWILLPAGIFAARLPLAALARVAILPAGTYGWLDLLGGLGLFVVNAVVLIWCVSALGRRKGRSRQAA